MRTCSQPNSRNAVHNRSAHATAAVNNASDIRGAIFFAPNATAKCPMNMLHTPPVIRTNARSIVPFVGLNLGLENFGGMSVEGLLFRMSELLLRRQNPTERPVQILGKGSTLPNA